MKQDKQMPLFYTSLLYLIGCILFLEWLYPAREIGDTASLHVFIFYALFCMGITAVSPKWWLSVLLKGVGMLIAIQELFISEPFLSKAWFMYLGNDLWQNTQLLVAQEWYELTPLFRTFLFLLAIWLISYLIHYWFVVTRRFLLFVVLTFVYLSIIDTFTFYNASSAIIRVFIVSLTALGLANFFKEINKESISFNWNKRTTAWVFPLLIFVLFSSVVGYASPKFNPQWPDPVYYIKTVTGEDQDKKDSTIRKSGYSDENAELGGPFMQDDSVVFEAIATEEQYWRVDSKDVYTGKGWESSFDQVKNPSRSERIRLNIYNPDVDKDEKRAMITFEEDEHIGYLPYPYEASTIHVPEDGIGIQYEKLGAILAQENGDTYDLDQYGITYGSPNFTEEELRGADDGPQEIVEPQYSKLPESIPDRVTELAEEIAEPYDTNYDKATAIEQYFSENDYRYETEDIPFPEEDEDYVDQFLFETQYGYCDNYSTSMVVMLRALDIPSRWVTGYTSGEMIEENIDVGELEELGIPSTNEDFNKYEVKNLNAHSWVEVYFPRIGWVPFEPTPGFDGSTNIRQSDPDLDEEDNEDNFENEDELDKEDEEPIIPESEEDNDGSGAKDEKGSVSPYMWLLSTLR